MSERLSSGNPQERNLRQRAREKADIAAVLAPIVLAAAALGAGTAWVLLDSLKGHGNDKSSGSDNNNSSALRVEPGGLPSEKAWEALQSEIGSRRLEAIVSPIADSKNKEIASLGQKLREMLSDGRIYLVDKLVPVENDLTKPSGRFPDSDLVWGPNGLTIEIPKTEFVKEAFNNADWRIRFVINMAFADNLDSPLGYSASATIQEIIQIRDEAYLEAFRKSLSEFGPEAKFYSR